MKNLVMLLFVVLAILMLGRIFWKWDHEKLFKENASKQEAFIYQKGDGFNSKKTKAWIVYPKVAVVNDFFDYNSAASDCSFTINDGSDKEKFACLRVFDGETGIAIFLASEKMEITKDENIPQWAKDSTAVIIDYFIDKEILEKILEQEELLWEEEIEESGELESNPNDIMQNRYPYPLIRNIQSKNREFISRFYFFYFTGIIVRMAKLNIIFIIFIVLVIFSFWPNLIGAHYSGAISCPILSGSMAGCANIAEHINLVISSISDFKGIFNFILAFNIFALFVFITKVFGGNFILLPKVKKNCCSFLIKFLNLAANSAKSGNLLFLGLKRGILNTKVF